MFSFYVIFWLLSIVASAGHPILAHVQLHAHLMDTQLYSYAFTIMLFIEIHYRALFECITCFLLAEITQLIEDPSSYIKFRQKPPDLSTQHFQLGHTYKTTTRSTSDTIVTWLIFDAIACLCSTSSNSHVLCALYTLKLMLRHRNSNMNASYFITVIQLLSSCFVGTPFKTIIKNFTKSIFLQ